MRGGIHLSASQSIYNVCAGKHSSASHSVYTLSAGLLVGGHPEPSKEVWDIGVSIHSTITMSPVLHQHVLTTLVLLRYSCQPSTLYAQSNMCDSHEPTTVYAP